MQNQCSELDIGISLGTDDDICVAFNTQTGAYQTFLSDKDFTEGTYLKIESNRTKRDLQLTVVKAKETEFSETELNNLKSIALVISRAELTKHDIHGTNGKLGTIRHKLRRTFVKLGITKDPLQVEKELMQTCPEYQQPA